MEKKYNLIKEINNLGIYQIEKPITNSIYKIISFHHFYFMIKNFNSNINFLYLSKHFSELVIGELSLRLGINLFDPITKKICQNNWIINLDTNKLITFFIIKYTEELVTIPNNFQQSKPEKKSDKKTDKKPRKKSIPLTLKRKVWAKWIGENIGKIKCPCCKLTDITQMSFSCGHIIPESQGGQLTVDNLRPICTSCNSSMNTQNMHDFISKYKL